MSVDVLLAIQPSMAEIRDSLDRQRVWNGPLRDLVYGLEEWGYVSYLKAHKNASLMLSDGEEPAMIRSLSLEQAYSAFPGIDYADSIARPVNDGLDDAIAGRPSRNDYSTDWDLTAEEVAAMEPAVREFVAARLAVYANPS